MRIRHSASQRLAHPLRNLPRNHHRDPPRLSPFWLALEIEAEPHEAGEHHFSLRFVDEDGNIFFEDHLIGQFKRRPDLSPSYLYMAETIEVRKEIEKRGTYRFDMVWNDQVLGQLRLEIS